MHIKEYLKSVKIRDPLERSNAVAVQIVLLLLGILVPLVWTFGRANDSLEPRLFTRWLVPAAALIGFWWLRKGNFRGAVSLVLAAFVVHFSAELALLGLFSRRNSLAAILFVFVFAGLVVGRRTLWLLFMSMVAALIAGALRDIPELWPSTAAALHPGRNNQLSNFVFSALFLTVILDRFGTALRTTYRQAVQQAGELAELHRMARDAEARFRVALEGSLDAFVVWTAVRDTDGRIVDFAVVDANDRAARLTGTTRERVIGTLLAEVAPAALQKGGSFDRFVRVTESRQTSEEEFAPAAMPGVTWVRQQVVPVNDGVATIIRDLTAQRAIQQEMGALRDQFLQAQKMEVVGVLASSVAHDFNNFLTVISGQVEFLRAESLSQDGQEAVQQIANSAGRAANLTRTLLAFGRRQGSDASVLRLNEIVRNSRLAWERLLGARVSLTVDLGDEESVRLCPGEFEQVVLNLLVNARDAMPNGGNITMRTGVVRLESSALVGEQLIDVGAWVTLEVSDSGPGIPADHVGRIFEPFFTTKAAGRGTGLGLATVKRLVTEHGGIITVDSRAGAGTTFRVYWPAVTAAAESAAVPPSLAEQVKLALGGAVGPANRLEGPGSGLPGPRAVPAPPTQPGQPPS